MKGAPDNFRWVSHFISYRNKIAIAELFQQTFVGIGADHGTTCHLSLVTSSKKFEIMHELDLIKKRLKKYKKKRQILNYKKKLKALRNWQVDVKDLIDIPNIYSML
jgi:hypothetical protein